MNLEGQVGRDRAHFDNDGPRLRGRQYASLVEIHRTDGGIAGQSGEESGLEPQSRTDTGEYIGIGHKRRERRCNRYASPS